MIRKKDKLPCLPRLDCTRGILVAQTMYCMSRLAHVRSSGMDTVMQSTTSSGATDNGRFYLTARPSTDCTVGLFSTGKRMTSSTSTMPAHLLSDVGRRSS